LPDITNHPITCVWSKNGTPVLTNATTTTPTFNVSAQTDPTALDGDYTLTISNSYGATNVGWKVRAFYPGMVAAWGDNPSGQTARPAYMTNAISLSAGLIHSVAAMEDGTVEQWGEAPASIPSSATNVIAVGAGSYHVLALRSDGTVITWGSTNSSANFVPTNAVGVAAISAGWDHNLALLSNKTVTTDPL
jgi:hypothetical protein